MFRTLAKLTQELGKELFMLTIKRFLENSGRFKRVRRSVKRAPNANVYEFKRECLSESEQLSEPGRIGRFYGDESRVSLQPCVPYARKFFYEQVVIPSEQGGGVNCFALLSRGNRVHAHLRRRRSPRLGSVSGWISFPCRWPARRSSSWTARGFTRKQS